MDKKNKMLSLPEELLSKIKVIATLKKMSMTAYATRVLELQIKEDMARAGYQTLDLSRR